MTAATLVILPGLDGTDVFFRPLVAALAPDIHVRVVCYPPVRVSGYDELMPIVRNVVAEAAPCYVLGSSFAGPLAVRLASEEPSHVRGVILLATFLRSPQRRFSHLRFAIVGPVVWVLRGMRRVPVLFRRPDDALRVAKAETWSRVPAGVLAARARAAVAVDVREAMSRCAQPVLCVSFDRDDVVPLSNAEEIRQYSPAAELVTLPGGHLAMFADPQPLAGVITSFVMSVEEEDGSTRERGRPIRRPGVRRPSADS